MSLLLPASMPVTHNSPRLPLDQFRSHGAEYVLSITTGHLAGFKPADRPAAGRAFSPLHITHDRSRGFS
jgi:hypothetical protein